MRPKGGVMAENVELTNCVGRLWVRAEGSKSWDWIVCG